LATPVECCRRRQEAFDHGPRTGTVAKSSKRGEKMRTEKNLEKRGRAVKPTAKNNHIPNAYLNKEFANGE